MNSLSVITELKGFGSICQVCHFCYCEEIDFYIVSLENALEFRSLIGSTQKHTNTDTHAQMHTAWLSEIISPRSHSDVQGIVRTGRRVFRTNFRDSSEDSNRPYIQRSRHYYDPQHQSL